MDKKKAMEIADVVFAVVIVTFCIAVVMVLGGKFIWWLIGW